MKHRTKLFLVAFAIIVGTLLLMAGVGGTGPRYVGRFFGDGTGLSNSVDLVEGPNILITPGPGNRAYTIESTAAGAAGIFTNSIMGYGDEYRTNYVRISPGGVSLTGGGSFAGNGIGLSNVVAAFVDGFLTNSTTGQADTALAALNSGTITVLDTADATSFVSLFESATGDLAAKTDAALTYNATSGTLAATAMAGNGVGLSNVVAAFVNGFLTNSTTGQADTALAALNSGTVTVADTADATSFVALFESATGDMEPKTDGQILYNATTGVLAVGGLNATGTVSGVRFAGSGAGLTNVNLVNALSVGAVGNGVADDTAALQAAFNITTNGVWLPPGTYLITNTLVLKGFPHIVGSGIQNTFIKASAGGADTGLEGGNMIQLATYAAGGAMNGGLLRDFSVDGSGIAANGIVVGGGAAYTNATGYMEDMEVKWCTNAGVLVLASQEFHIMNSSLSWNYNGIYSTTNTVGSDHSTTLYVDHCKIQANTNCGVYLNYAQTFRFRDNVIQGSGGPGVWFHHGGQLLSWAFVDVLFSGNYFEQNNITAAYRQIGQVRLDTHETYPADKIVFENNYFNSPPGAYTTNFLYIGPAYAVLKDNYFAPPWGCITVSNAATVNIMGSSVNTGNTDETGGLCGPDVYFQNTTTALPADANISWTYLGQTNNTEKTISPKRFSTWVNNGDGHLVPASMLFGSTSAAGATAWFPMVMANTGLASAANNQAQPVIIMVQNTNTASANWTNTTLVNQVYYISGGTNVVVGINDLTTVMSWPSYIGNATVILQPTEWLLLDYDSNPQVVRKAF